MGSRLGRPPGRTAAAISVLVAHPDRHERAAMRAVLEAGEHVWVVALTGDGGEALALAHQLRPTVTLLDDRIPAPGGADLVQAITQRSLVITLTQSTEPRAIYTKLCAPVRGCLVYGHFEPPDLLGAVRAVAAGLGWLSPVAVAAVTATMRESAVRATAPRPDGGSSRSSGGHGPGS